MDLVTEQKLERRERILAAARELIAERPYEAITVRDLARRCRVSVPTLYKQFGGKDAVLAAAVEGHFRELLGRISATAEPAGHRRLLVIVETCAEQMASLADYHRALLRAFAEVPETRALHETLAVELTGVVARELTEMQRRRQLATWALPDLLAAQVTTACISASVVWARGAVGERGLRSLMIYACGLLLLGPARGAARNEIEREVRDAQAALAPELRAAAQSASSTGRRAVVG